ncbi:hypothetical protein RFI_09294 [Reticulomyxa filosa]|uniref:RRM domain-containing protein n=1 Tax=Reticulomyxa filosa TaxID=46433 RepID=X6NR68_RETFI|nr:hypothetical protein RFI_09294 [Reticulomyxa filosa]|eukprot:ETO27837.1 hypothetical protein RFI_09294 [Reticulomyxa filosa]
MTSIYEAKPTPMGVKKKFTNNCTLVITNIDKNVTEDRLKLFLLSKGLDVEELQLDDSNNGTHRKGKVLFKTISKAKKALSHNHKLMYSGLIFYPNSNLENAIYFFSLPKKQDSFSISDAIIQDTTNQYSKNTSTVTKKKRSRRDKEMNGRTTTTSRTVKKAQLSIEAKSSILESDPCTTIDTTRLYSTPSRL